VLDQRKPNRLLRLAEKETSFYGSITPAMGRLARQILLLYLVISSADVDSLTPQQETYNLSIATDHIQNGSYRLAVDLLRPIINHDPSSIMARYHLGNAYRLQRLYYQAAKTLEPILGLKPTDRVAGETHIFLAEIYIQLGQLNLALNQATAAVAKVPEIAEAHFHLGKIYLKQKKLDLANSAFKQATIRNPDFADACQELGNIALLQARPILAVGFFQQVADLAPFNYRPHLGLMKAYRLSNNQTLAEKHQIRFRDLKKYFDQVYDLELELKDRPTDPQILFRIAELHYKYQNLSAAIEQYQKILIPNPQSKPAWDQLGRIYMQTGDFESAIKAFESLIGLNPEPLEAYLRLSWIYTQQQRFDLAKQLLQKAIQLSPDLTLAYHGLAEVHLAEGDAAQALATYERIVELGDRGPDILIMLGQLRSENGRTNQALTAFQEAIKLRQTDPRPYRHIAQIYVQANLYLDTALKYAKQAVKLNPGAAEMSTLALVHFGQNQLQMAESSIQQALVQEPNNPDYLQQLHEIQQAKASGKGGLHQDNPTE